VSDAENRAKRAASPAGGRVALAVPVFSLLAAVIAASAAAMEKGKEPTGLGTARFGMSVEQVQKIHPDLQELRPGEKLAAAAVYTPNIRRFVLRGQKLAGTEKPATVELRFWKDQLWLYITYFDTADTSGVVAGLEKQFGPPDHNEGERPLWTGDRTLIVGELKRGWFTIQDETISRQAQTWFSEAAAASQRERHLPLKGATPAAVAPGGPATPPAPPER
jgi:hypothetical protein